MLYRMASVVGELVARVAKLAQLASKAKFFFAPKGLQSATSFAGGMPAFSAPRRHRRGVAVTYRNGHHRGVRRRRRASRHAWVEMR